MLIVLGLAGVVVSIIALAKDKFPSLGIKTRAIGIDILVFSIIFLCSGTYTAGLSNQKHEEISESKQTHVNQAIKIEDFILQVGSKDITVIHEDFTLNRLIHEDFTLNAPVIELNGNSYIPLKFFLDWYCAKKINYDAKTENITFSLSRYENLETDIREKYKRKNTENDLSYQEEKEEALFSVNEKEAKKAIADEQVKTKEVNVDVVLSLFKKQLEEVGNVEIDRVNRVFKLTPTDEDVIYDFLILGLGPTPELETLWAKVVQRYIEISKELPGYEISITDPYNKDTSLLTISDGVVLYDYFSK